MKGQEKEEWVNKAKSFLSKSYYGYNFLVYQYDDGDHLIQDFIETKLYTSPNFRDYYYRLAPFKDLPRGKVYAEHFGVSVSNEGSNCFDLGIYENQLINDLISICNTPEELLKTLNGNLRWHYRKFVDLSRLNHDDFDEEINSFRRAFPVLTEITDLHFVEKKRGLYIMVLDDYASCYIGQAKDIMRRIRQHWRRISFCTDGIDMFKAFDTTRIFVICVDSTVDQGTIDRLEYAFIHAIDRKYLLNCLGGGGSLEWIHSDSHDIGYGTNPI